ncbi:HNH endonuclease [Candidatus Poribacteria bacterium]|nr:HNH endonuclease [Candidatus Poribacteria bacterium]MBT5710106.1 HNH endonuclease [Candidatus Poribacteria bacterium]MBT7806164.1 HNH endonuclease [Candidatus Poribacteria bacterium]
MAARQRIPASIHRAVLVEAGHRCAIPTCRSYPVDVHHIQAQEDGGEDSFENLIALCTACHARVHRTKEIDPRAARQYKANLAVTNGRYSELERRVLEFFVLNAGETEVVLSGALVPVLFFLLREEIVQAIRGPVGGAQITMQGVDNLVTFRLTEKGVGVIGALREGQPI